MYMELSYYSIIDSLYYSYFFSGVTFTDYMYDCAMIDLSHAL